MKAAGEIEATSLDISGGVDIAGAITSAEWTGDVIASAGDLDEIKNKLGDVTQGLSIAFVTTLEALVAALSVQLTLISIQRQEEQLLDDTREYCQRELVSRVRITATDWSSSLDQET
jgi:hypothetical protein